MNEHHAGHHHRPPAARILGFSAKELVTLIVAITGVAGALREHQENNSIVQVEDQRYTVLAVLAAKNQARIDTLTRAIRALQRGSKGHGTLVAVVPKPEPPAERAWHWITSPFRALF